MKDQVPDVHGLAAAVRGGEIARAAFDGAERPASGGDGADGAASRGNGDVDRP
jgi:hypothetical protein